MWSAVIAAFLTTHLLSIDRGYWMMQHDMFQARNAHTR